MNNRPFRVAILATLCSFPQTAYAALIEFNGRFDNDSNITSPFEVSLTYSGPPGFSSNINITTNYQSPSFATLSFKSGSLEYTAQNTSTQFYHPFSCTVATTLSGLCDGAYFNFELLNGDGYASIFFATNDLELLDGNLLPDIFPNVTSFEFVRFTLVDWATSRFGTTSNLEPGMLPASPPPTAEIPEPSTIGILSLAVLGAGLSRLRIGSTQGRVLRGSCPRHI